MDWNFPFWYSLAYNILNAFKENFIGPYGVRWNYLMSRCAILFLLVPVVFTEVIWWVSNGYFCSISVCSYIHNTYVVIITLFDIENDGQNNHFAWFLSGVWAGNLVMVCASMSRVRCFLNSLRPSDTYMRQYNIPTLVQVMHIPTTLV